MSLKIPLGGFVPLSTVDWPGKLAAVAFAQGCPWRCPYCHNRHLQQFAEPALSGAEVLGQLRRRAGFLDGVVFSGGEPTLHPELIDDLEAVRSLGFECALHTGGAYPQRLEQILAKGLVSWVGFDVKAPFERYGEITGRENSGALARRSLEILAASGVEYELRTTVWPQVLDEAALRRMAEEIAEFGRGRLVLQRCLAPGKPPPSPEPLLSLAPALGAAGVR